MSDEPAGREHDHLRAIPGGWFLVHHVGVAVATEEVSAVEVIGEPSSRAGALTVDDDRTPWRCSPRWG